jgi:hypothetical protein
MPNIVVCEKPEDLKGMGSDSIVVISRSNLIPFFAPEKIRRLKKILDTLKEHSTEAERHWFEIPIIDIEIHEITKRLRTINENIKVFNEKILSLDLIQALLKSGIIPVLII